MFALLALLAGFVFGACAYGSWENRIKGYWVWAVVSTASFVLYGLQINS